jgi:hypothetical protein
MALTRKQRQINDRARKLMEASGTTVKSSTTKREVYNLGWSSALKQAAYELNPKPVTVRAKHILDKAKTKNAGKESMQDKKDKERQARNLAAAKKKRQ